MIRKQAFFFLRNPRQFLRWTNKLLVLPGTPEADENSLNLSLRSCLKDLTRDASCSCIIPSLRTWGLCGHSELTSPNKEQKRKPFSLSSQLLPFNHHQVFYNDLFLFLFQPTVTRGTGIYLPTAIFHPFIFNFSNSLYHDNLPPKPEPCLWLPMEPSQ